MKIRATEQLEKILERNEKRAEKYRSLGNIALCPGILFTTAALGNIAHSGLSLGNTLGAAVGTSALAIAHQYNFEAEKAELQAYIMQAEIISREQPAE